MALDPVVVEHALLARLVADRGRGEVPDRARYCELFPGHEALVERVMCEYAAVEDDVDRVSDRRRIGPFEIEEEIGRGGQGVVYRARDLELPRTVALKVLGSAGALNDERRTRFRREAEAAARLDHPALCRVLNFGVEGSLLYLAMPFVEGETLAHALAKARKHPGEPAAMLELPESSSSHKSGSSRVRSNLERVLRLFEVLAEGLEVAHQSGIVHRDLKPSNVMLTPQGQPVLLDFGLARDDQDPEESITRTGDLLGTPAYMAPEQITGAFSVDRRTDLYALGVMLYETLCGRRPFVGATRQALFDEILKGLFVLPSHIARDLPPELDLVLKVALEHDPARRYESALAFAEDLRRVRQREPVLARPTPRMVRVRRWAERNRGVAISMVLFSAIAIGAGIAVTTAWFRAEDARAEAEAINEFILNDLLAAANPSGLGREARIVDALEICARRVSERLGDKPLLAASVRHQLSKTFSALGLWSEARDHCTQALAARTEHLGASHERTLECEVDLARYLGEEGKHAEAEAHLEHVLGVYRDRFGGDDERTLCCRAELGFVQILTKGSEMGLAEVKSAAARCRELYGAESKPARLALRRLRGAYFEAGLIAEALPLIEEEVELCKRVEGPDAFETVDAEIVLGQTLLEGGFYAPASEVLERAVERARKALGEAHPTFFFALSVLGSTYDLQRRSEDAERVLRASLEGYRRVLGADNRHALTLASNLAIFFRHTRKTAEAKQLASEVLELRRARFGEDDDVAESYDVLAAILIDDREYEQAIEHSTRAIAIIERLHGPESSRLASVLFNMGIAQQRSGDLDAALPTFERILAIDLVGLGADNPYVAQDRVRLGELLCAKKRFDDAVAQFEEGLRIRLAEVPQNIARLSELRAWLGHAYYFHGVEDRALELIERAWNDLRQLDDLSWMKRPDALGILEQIYRKRDYAEADIAAVHAARDQFGY